MDLPTSLTFDPDDITNLAPPDQIQNFSYLDQPDFGSDSSDSGIDCK